MDIRETDFWQSIEQIFPDQDAGVSSPGVPGHGRRQISYPQFRDRLSLSAQRTRRHDTHLLLLLAELEVPRNSTGESGVGRNNERLISRLSSCLRANDSLCRLGANRFALLLEDIKEPSVVPLVLEKLLTTMNGPMVSEHDSGEVTANIGATLFPVEGLAFDGIWSAAETALRQATEEASPGAYRIAPLLTGREAMERFELSKDLYRAHRHKEFETVYQPIMDLGAKRICGLEAYLRWKHPTHGNLRADAFLPLLEESGVIVPVGERMIAETCMMFRRLLNAGCNPLRACINVSGRQLADSGFLLSVLDALYESDLDPGLLQLEFAESVLAGRPQLMQRVLPELQNAGIHLALDHFGLGEVPLAELIRLPINLVKIDRTLVEHLQNDAVSKSVVSGTIALANAAGMQVAAVGVEQLGQADFLEKIGCREVQGSFYSAPLPGAELETGLPNRAGLREQ